MMMIIDDRCEDNHCVCVCVRISIDLLSISFGEEHLRIDSGNGTILNIIRAIAVDDYE